MLFKNDVDALYTAQYTGIFEHEEDILIAALDDRIIDELAKSISNERKEEYDIPYKRTKEQSINLVRDFLSSQAKHFYENRGSRPDRQFIIIPRENIVVPDFDPNNAEYWYLSSREHYEKYSWKDYSLLNFTIGSSLKAVELDPNNAKYWHWLGKLYYENNQSEYDYLKKGYKKTIESFLKAAELDPNDANNWNWLGTSYYRARLYDKAIESFLKAAELDPNDANNWNWLGTSYYRARLYDKAIESFLKVVELNPNEDNFINLSCSYIKTGQYDKAIESFLKYKDSEPKNDYIFSLSYYGFYDKNRDGYKSESEIYIQNLTALGRLLYAFKYLHDEAIECLLKARELDPNNSSVYMHLGKAYCQTVQYDKAVECFEKVLELDPDSYYENWLYVGNSYINSGQYDKAIEYLLKVFETVKLDVICHLLGKAYCQTGEYYKAVEYLLKVKTTESPINIGSYWSWLGISYYRIWLGWDNYNYKKLLKVEKYLPKSNITKRDIIKNEAVKCLLKAAIKSGFGTSYMPIVVIILAELGLELVARDILYRRKIKDKLLPYFPFYDIIYRIFEINSKISKNYGSLIFNSKLYVYIYLVININLKDQNWFKYVVENMGDEELVELVDLYKMLLYKLESY